MPLNCTKTDCHWNKDSKCRLGSEVDELVDDYVAEDIPKDCLYYDKIKAAAEAFEA